MKRTFVCASSCIKQYVQPSYGCHGMRIVARMCIYTAQTFFKYIKFNYKKYWNKNEKHFKNEQKVGMLLQKRTDTRGVGISSMRKSIYLHTTIPTSHTHTFHPLSTIVIHILNFAQVQNMDDNCGEWVECMGVASGCG